MNLDVPDVADLADLTLFGPLPGDAALCREADANAISLARAVGDVSPVPAVRTKVLDRIGEASRSFVKRAGDSEWENWLMPGVKRRILFVDRRSRRVTLLLRLAAGGQVPAHTHPGVEEIYILDGDLQDKDGNVLRAGDYQRSEAGSTHVGLWSVGGCTALVMAPLGGKTRA